MHEIANLIKDETKNENSIVSDNRNKYGDIITIIILKFVNNDEKTHHHDEKSTVTLNQ